MHRRAYFTNPTIARLFARRCADAGFAVCIDGSTVRW